ncbi:MAG: UDP-glucose 4-epimerase [Candidatus Aenigmarchaeota archaeon CG01_land_8_20_14_3_00_37_9]|nr:MAG: UDP-glucose 4-epimerase [Candidatus Aenigmarchaeota archaeon CG01_land_8_20_14_3_00_37_9]
MLDGMCNIIGTINVLEACRRSKVKRIIYTSTGGARVGEPEYQPVDEKHALNPCSPYGISKHTGEHYIWMYNKIHGLDSIIFCFGNVYGPRDNPSCQRIIPFFIDLILKGQSPKIIGDGKQTRDFIYVDDLVEFIVNSINEKPKNRLFYLSKGKQYSINEIVKLLKKISNLPIEPEYINKVKGEVKEIVLDCSLAKKELGWKPKTEIEEGLKKTFEWYKKNRDYFWEARVIS